LLAAVGEYRDARAAAIASVCQQIGLKVQP
jgi:hypothetical protein